MGLDPRNLLPRHKSDMANARAVVALGYPAVAPVLPELLEWLKDCNWPVSGPICELLASLPEQMAPLIRSVLHGDDHIWKYACSVRLIRVMPTHIAEQFRPELTRLAERPTPAERAEMLDEAARDVLQSPRPSGTG